MTNKLTPIVEALTRYGDAIAASNMTDETLRQQYGWNFPNLTAKQMAIPVFKLRDRIASIDANQVATKWEGDWLVTKIDEESANTIAYLWNGNGAEAFKTYTGFLQYIEAYFFDLFNFNVKWDEVSKSGAVPPEITKRVRSIRARLKGLDTSIDSLDEKVAAITSAHDAALALPTDMEALEEARARISDLSEEIERDAGGAAANTEKIREIFDEITKKRDEAVQLVIRTEDAYSAATTMGLGAAFEARAKSLANSMWIWVGALFFALVAGGVIGWLRISLVEQLLEKNTSPTAIWINTLLSALSIAAPVWLAWIATKQIGQRFRLSEDYAFKASVAKAYEGYRREAARLDPAFAHKLFGSALDRLEEAPLRFVEHETDGSPWHEVMRKRLEDARRRLQSNDKVAQSKRPQKGITKLEEIEEDRQGDEN